MPEEVLGEEFAGIVSCDCYVGYNRLLAEKQRCWAHLLEWFVFVEHPEVPSTNNLAERSLRPAVIARKISGGTRSDKGSKTKTALMSLAGTLALREEPLLPAFQSLLLAPS